MFLPIGQRFAIEYEDQIRRGSITDALIDAACVAGPAVLDSPIETNSNASSVYGISESSVTLSGASKTSGAGSFDFDRHESSTANCSDASYSYGLRAPATDAEELLHTPESSEYESSSEASTVPFPGPIRVPLSPPTLEDERPQSPFPEQINEPLSPQPIVNEAPRSPEFYNPGTPHRVYEPTSPRPHSPDPYAPREAVAVPQYTGWQQQHIYAPESPPPAYNDIFRQQQQQQRGEQQPQQQGFQNNINGMWPQPMNDVEAMAVQMAQAMFFHMQMQTSRSMVLFDADPRMVTARMTRSDWDDFRRYQEITSTRWNQMQHFNRYLDRLANGVHVQHLLDLAIGGPHNIYFRQ